MFSSRVPSSLAANALSTALTRARERGASVLDLTVTNPTSVGIEYPDGLLEALASPGAHAYHPEPAGMHTAREALAGVIGELGHGRPAVDDLLLTASTSEAYAVLFKLLCDAGDHVLIPRPSYPLFEHLAALENVLVSPYELAEHWEWSVDVEALEAAWTPRTRAVVVVSPNNPTGTVVRDEVRQRLLEWCAGRNVALIVDEVFRWYPLGAVPTVGTSSSVVGVRSSQESPGTDDREPRTTTRIRTQHQRILGMEAGAAPRVRPFLDGRDVPGLVFALDGLSKSCGLPQVKLAWIQLAGPAGLAGEARRRLELILDTYLSVSTPVQVAFPALWRQSASVRDVIRARLHDNLVLAHDLLPAESGCSLVAPDGGWSLAIRVPAVVPEEQLALDLLEREGVLVHPGYFFDFPAEAYLVLSLLPRSGDFAEGLSRVVQRCRIA